jgi:MSHA pilin protein MshC
MAQARPTNSVTDGKRLPCFRAARSQQAGLTIVELVLVIVIVGVLGALAGPRFFNNQTFAERAYAEELASALRYAQKVSVGSGCRVRVQVAANSYSLSQQAPQAGHCNPADNSFPVTVLLSSGQTASGTAPTGIAVAPPTTIIFDALGGTSLAGNAAFTIGIHTLTVEAASGLVQGPL